MTALVIDASALIPLFFEEENTGESHEIFASREYDRLAPTFLAVEFSNVLATGLRRKRITPAEASQHLRDFGALDLELKPFPSRSDLQHVLDLADRTALSFHDAIYLALAQRHGALLATYDKALLKAARDSGVGSIE